MLFGKVERKKEIRAFTFLTIKICLEILTRLKIKKNAYVDRFTVQYTTKLINKQLHTAVLCLKTQRRK